MPGCARIDSLTLGKGGNRAVEQSEEGNAGNGNNSCGQNDPVRHPRYGNSKSWSIVRAALSEKGPKELSSSLAARLKTKTLAEEGERMILETIGYLARVSAWVHFEAVPDSIPIKNFMQLARIAT
jgi:hypothetical protein